MLDPVTAAFLYARSENLNGDLKVCDQTVPVFDGKQRFNLILKPQRTAKLDKNASTGYSGFAAVCGVKFIPISGDRPDNPGISSRSSARKCCAADPCGLWLGDVDLIRDSERRRAFQGRRRG